jgi:arylsulfatase A-like enzyme
MMNRLTFTVTVIWGLAAAIGLGCGSAETKGDGEGRADTPSTSLPSKSITGADNKGASGAHANAVPVAEARGPERVAFSMWDNRLLAHHQRHGGLFIPAGSHGFIKYLRFGKGKRGWELAADKGGVRAGITEGKVAGIHVPLTAAQIAGARFRARVHSDGEQTLGLRINGNRSKEVVAELKEGWQVAELAIPDGTLVDGENELLMFARKSPLAFEWIHIGGSKAPGENAASWSVPEKKALRLPPGGGVAYYVMVPDNGLITGDINSATCTVAVKATPHQGEAITGALLGKGSAVDLGGLAGKVVRLDLAAQGCDEDTALGEPALVISGRKPQLNRGPAPRHVIFWIMDSLRADRMKLYNPAARAEIPVFEELAKKSAVFTQAYVHGNETRASHASIWTSQHVINHGMIPGRNPGNIDKSWYTIDEVAADAKLFTSGVSGNGYITPRRGFGTKWDKYRNHIHDGGGLTAEKIVGKAIESLEGKEKEPWFLYIGTIDTHVSWRAKEPWFSRYDDKPYSGRFKREASGTDMGKVAGGSLKVDERDKERIRALYDSNISYQDQQLGVLLEWLETQGIAGQTMLIITADHGDELFEDGRVGHGGSTRESLVWVPLIVHYPPLLEPGRYFEGAETIDIVPTVADALGVKADPKWQGESLIPLTHGFGKGYPRLTISSKYENAFAARMGMFKMRIAGGSAEMYDLSADIDETKDVAASRPLERRMISDAFWMLRAFNAEWRKAEWGNPANVTPAFAAHFN